MSFADPQVQLDALLTQGGRIHDIISKEELLKKFAESQKKNKPLVVKFGADPSRPDIHLGHTLILRKLRLLQDFGHEVYFIIGDFTAMIGDPTGRTKTRPPLTEDEVKANALTYQEQVFLILDRSRTHVVYNSTWLNALKPMDFIKLMASQTVGQMIAREDFSKRFKEETPIFLHEFVYPIMQGYDSVHLRADIEFGATDQTFNLLVGREMQKSNGQAPQALVLLPILEGLDGVRKMSKSYDNYVGIHDAPTDIFGKIMSVSDELMLRYYELLSDMTPRDLELLQANLKAEKVHPMEAKKALAEEITARFSSKEIAAEERRNFDERFSKKVLPKDLPIFELILHTGETIDLLDLSIKAGFNTSRGEARRVLKQSGMRIDGETATDEKLEFRQEFVFQQGKLKVVKVVVVPT